ncbi:phosphate signaling complex protein PhoU [Pseudaeromonas sharmana]|uniref:Phosphate-specific transport system accessory protein PhoU n=1 Tax=Pseudaeromonas sharmana TaxID=328412 RepID=A0ABV8CR81_9GAMM
MDNMNLNKHISGQFNTELEAVRNNVLAMGGLVEQQLSDALVAIHDQDHDLARRIVETDLQVNNMEISIDEECTRIIAKRQPTASDLRLILMISKTVTDLERMGDVADKLARMVLNNKGSQAPLVSIENMGRQAIKMLHDALDAFARMDVEAAIQLYHDDDKIDRQYESIIRELMTYMMEDPRTIPQVLEVLWAARSIERIGDRCQHISDYIIYCVKGKDVRHTKISDVDSL